MKRWSLTLPLLAGCAAAAPAGSPLSGNWGGIHADLHLSASGGTLDYDCAHGTIGPVIPADGGRFTAEGTHTPEHGGPVREGEVLPRLQVHYSGRVEGDRMTLRGRLADGVEIGPFELRHGAPPQIFRCL